MAPTITRSPIVQILEPRAELFDNADRFMAKNQTRFDRILTAHDVHIGAADGRRRHANHGFARLRPRLGHFHDGNAVLALEHYGLHRLHGTLAKSGAVIAGPPADRKSSTNRAVGRSIGGVKSERFRVGISNRTTARPSSDGPPSRVVVG